MKKYLLILSGLGALTLSACESTREQFDFSKKAPDEFAVTTRAPLEIPPTLNTLPKPRPGAPRPQEMATNTQAKKALFGESAINNQVGETISAGEDVLLQKTGAYSVNTNIRDTIDQETENLAEENVSTFDKIRGKLGDKTDVPASVIDPKKEVERLRANQQSGVPITQGKTPTKDQ